MKELDSNFNLQINSNKTELNVKKQQQIEYLLQGKLKPKIGHFIWEIEECTGEVRKAEFKQATAVFGAKLPPLELVKKTGCIYIPALNAENAKKKYAKNKVQSYYYEKPPIMDISDLSFMNK